MSAQIVIQNPENVTVGFNKIRNRVNAGIINYSSFERNIENIAFVDNSAIVMGSEILIPLGTIQTAGKTVKRSFTNIRMEQNGF